MIGTVPIANDDVFAVEMNGTLEIGAPGVLWNDVPPPSTSPSVGNYTDPQHGELSLNADGSFTYIPDEDYEGEDSWIYYCSAGGVQSQQGATVRIYVGAFRLATPNGPWVPINANNDNGSAWRENTNNMVPRRRDFDFVQQLPANRTDPELWPLNVYVTPNPPNPLTAFVRFTITIDGSAEIRLWMDQRKTQQVLPGVDYVVGGANALPYTIYIEGVRRTSRTLNGMQVQDTPEFDVTISATLFVVLPWLPGQVPPPPLPLATSSAQVGVVPVLNSFTVDTSDSEVRFVNGVDGTQGITSFGPGMPPGAARFKARVFKDSIPGDLNWSEPHPPGRRSLCRRSLRGLGIRPNGLDRPDRQYQFPFTPVAEWRMIR